jgi:hypothetical protein
MPISEGLPPSSYKAWYSYFIHHPFVVTVLSGHTAWHRVVAYEADGDEPTDGGFVDLPADLNL